VESQQYLWKSQPHNTYVIVFLAWSPAEYRDPITADDHDNVFAGKFNVEFQHNGRLLREKGPDLFKFPWPPSKQPPELSVTFKEPSNGQRADATQFLETFRILNMALSSLGNAHLPMRPTLTIDGPGIHHNEMQNEVRISNGQRSTKMDRLD
jgi:hypothetical protein